MAALMRANEIRSARADFKADLKAGLTDTNGMKGVLGMISDPHRDFLTMKVFDLIMAMPKYGRVKTNRILQQCRIAPSKTLGGLTDRQRTELTALLRPRYSGRLF